MKSEVTMGEDNPVWESTQLPSGNQGFFLLFLRMKRMRRRSAQKEAVELVF